MVTGSTVEPAAPEEGLSARTISAAQWQLTGSGSKAVLQFGVTVLLARLLTPADFGLVALTLVVVNFADRVVDLGLGPAIVQREELTARHLRVSFTVSLLIGALAGAVMVAAAPGVAHLLSNPSVSPILRWQGVLFLFAGISATALALLERRLDFRSLCFVDVGSYLVGYGGVGVGLALAGFGVWSLVFGALAQAAVGATLALSMARHPLRPLLARTEMGDLFHFGFGVILNRMVVYASFNGDNFVVGRWLGAAALGLYNRAFQLMMLPLQHLGDITWSVLFSAFSRLQEDRPRAARAFLKGIQLTSLTLAPVMAGMMVAGPHLVVGLYGEEWIGAALPLQVLCAAAVLRAVASSIGAVTHAFGAVYAEFRRQSGFALLVVVGAWFGSRWGIGGVAFAVAGAVVVLYFTMAQLGLRVTGCRWGEFFAAQAPGLAVSGVVAAAALAVRIPLEANGAGSGSILLAVILACALATPAGLHLLPERLRPVDLFRSLDAKLGGLPSPARLLLRWSLRVPPPPLSSVL